MRIKRAGEELVQRAQAPEWKRSDWRHYSTGSCRCAFGVIEKLCQNIQAGSGSYRLPVLVFILDRMSHESDCKLRRPWPCVSPFTRIL